jgi:hypothetical protein
VSILQYIKSLVREAAGGRCLEIIFHLSSHANERATALYLALSSSMAVVQADMPRYYLSKNGFSE